MIYYVNPEESDDYDTLVQELRHRAECQIKSIHHLTEATKNYVRAYRALAAEDQGAAQETREAVIVARREAVRQLRETFKDAAAIRDELPLLATRMQFAAQKGITEIESY